VNEYRQRLFGLAMWLPEIGGWMSWGGLMQQFIAEHHAPGHSPQPAPPFPGARLERTLDAIPVDLPYATETLQ
jgi:hypothetical protein